MEIYFKNMTTEEVPTERLVEDLMKLIYDAEDLVFPINGYHMETGPSVNEVSLGLSWRM